MLILARTAPSEGAGRHRRLRCSTRISTGATSKYARSRRWGAMPSTRTCSSSKNARAADDRIGMRPRFRFCSTAQPSVPDRREAVGLGRAALARAVTYANEAYRVRPAHRTEPGDPASARAVLDGARSRRPDGVQGGCLYDRGEPCGRVKRCKYLAAEACFRACEQAILAHGAWVTRRNTHRTILTQAMIPRLAPVSPQLILCFIAEKVLGLPKSY
jgi:alkylation response protein AidB-like acyl-CoA dehydrogenase